MLLRLYRTTNAKSPAATISITTINSRLFITELICFSVVLFMETEFIALKSISCFDRVSSSTVPSVLMKMVLSEAVSLKSCLYTFGVI